MERTVPHDAEAEEAVVASAMVDDSAIHRLRPIVSPEDFLGDAPRWSFAACVALADRGEPINQITVAHELVRAGRLEEVGVAFLSRVIGELPTAVGCEHYGRIVRRDALYRHLITTAAQISEMAYRGGPEQEQVFSRADELLAALRRRGEDWALTPIRPLLDEYLEEPGIAAARYAAHLRTGFADLDTVIGGLRRQDFAVLGARPGAGKTSLVLNVARNAAVAQAKRVAIFSLEMSAADVVQRLLAAESGVDATRLRLGQQGEAEERRVLAALGDLSELELFVDETAVQTADEIAAKARRLHLDGALGLVIVDYLQLVHTPSSRSRDSDRTAEVTYVSRRLKELARELSVPVLACSQLSRAVEARKPPVPMLSDLRESGSIEQDADLVLMIYREDMYVTEEEWGRRHQDGRPYPKGLAQVLVEKNRNGPTGRALLRFRQEFTRFEDLVVREV